MVKRDLGNDRSPMPFGCVPIRRPLSMKKKSRSSPRLQCLSAVCLSGRSPEQIETRKSQAESPMPFGCVPIRQRSCALLRQGSGVSNAFRLCAYPAGIRAADSLEIWAHVSNAFRLCAYPAAMFTSWLPTWRSAGLQCLSAVCLFGRRRSGYPFHPSRKSPMPFGCVPIRQPRVCSPGRLGLRVSPMPFGCVPIRQPETLRVFPTPRRPLSPMPFGCVPIRQPQPHAAHRYRRTDVSNAFRLCAYPAELADYRAAIAAVRSPMPFGCVPIRQTRRTRRTSPPAWGLQCLSAVCLSGRVAELASGARFVRGLQCLSAVCLSGSACHRDGCHS